MLPCVFFAKTEMQIHNLHQIRTSNATEKTRLSYQETQADVRIQPTEPVTLKGTTASVDCFCANT